MKKKKKKKTHKVGGDDSVNSLGLHDHACRHGVDQHLLHGHVGELLGDLAGGGEEETVRHLHDGGLVDGANLVAADVLGVLEGIADDALAGGGWAEDRVLVQ